MTPPPKPRELKELEKKMLKRATGARPLSRSINPRVFDELHRRRLINGNGYLTPAGHAALVMYGLWEENDG